MIVGLMHTNIDQWSQWMQSKEPHRAPLPGKWGWSQKNSTGNDGSEVKEEESKYVWVNCVSENADYKMFEEEKLVFAATDFVASKLGDSFAEAPTVSMIDVYNDTNKHHVYLFWFLAPILRAMQL